MPIRAQVKVNVIRMVYHINRQNEYCHENQHKQMYICRSGEHVLDMSQIIVTNNWNRYPNITQTSYRHHPAHHQRSKYKNCKVCAKNKVRVKVEQVKVQVEDVQVQQVQVKPVHVDSTQVEQAHSKTIGTSTSRINKYKYKYKYGYKYIRGVLVMF